MNSKNLWDIPTTDEDMNSTNNVKPLIIKQADYLEEATNEKINAKFGKTNPTGAKGALMMVSRLASTLSGVEDLGNTEIEGVSTNNLQNADDFYTNETFGFEIYSDKYKFRIFEIRIPPMYPVFIRVDEDIFDEIKKGFLLSNADNKNKRIIEVSSDDYLEQYLETIFQSRKVRFILQKMLQKANDSAEQ